MEVPNLFRYAEEIEPEVEMERQRPRFEWKPVKQINDLTEHVVFAVHPQVVAYDSDLGFRFQEHGHASTSPEVRLSHRERVGFSYRQEAYVEHIRRVLAALDRIYAREVAWPASRLEARLGLDSGSLDRALRFTIACHDAGKLTSGWQRWAHEYQAGIGRPVTDEVLLAHTDYDSADPNQMEVQQRLRAKKPPHAAEGAAIVFRLAERVLPDERVGLAALSAIARHHSPTTETVQEKLNLHPRARETLAQALTCARLPLEPAEIPEPEPLQRLRCLAKADEADPFLVYLFLVRALRLADQASMEM
jgi:CRISPR-associated endonuclease/helicase Cas3